ncbi:hypothetical protein BDA99DRAFT_542402 [Phascolomyces articulosus]|uniref:YncI copper-binding domain-containing protein n=1 Tax=Phascolomyces articulosus TaxID=60185 RepID=A0AAD5K027_9FUNG|nr:hypothetical protein BDA99DRAFT_542402 [Phascolomyces articulosus]
MMMKSTLFALAALALQGAYAHTSGFTNEFALPGTTLTTALAIRHGCIGSPTIEVSVIVPEEITTIKPVELQNWTLNFEYRNTGQGNNQAISSFRWTGYLNPGTAQDFGMVIDIPNLDVSQGNVTLYFPTVQRCSNATIELTGEEAPHITVTQKISDEYDHHHDGDESGAPKMAGSFANMMAASMLGGAGYYLLNN